MNDVGTPVRKAFYDALYNQVTNPENGAVTVPVVDEKLDLNITEHDLYILIGGQAETPVNTKSSWADEVDLSITFVNRRKATNSKTIIENIANQAVGILFPTRTTFGITISEPFQLSYVKKVSAQYNFEKLNDGWQIQKSIVFKTRITQTP
jgi:hypothetical protein